MPGQVGKIPVKTQRETPDRLRVRIEGERYLRGLMEEIYPSARALQKTGARVELPRFSAEVAHADDDGVDELVFQFQPPSVAPRVVLDVASGHAHRLEPRACE